jgi:hypothetical protein
MWLAWAMLGIMAAWTLGLAWHANAMRKNWRRARDYAVGGAVSGLVLGSVGLIAILIGFTQASGDPVPLAYIIVATTLCLALGVCLMAATMWLVWLLRRPDRDHAPNIVGELD